MSKKAGSYEAVLEEKHKLELLFDAQKELVKYELSEIAHELDPALNALHYLKKFTQVNSDNPAIQTGINVLIELLAEKINGPDAGFIRTVIIPELLKRYASSVLSGHAEELIQHVISLFSNEEKAEDAT